MEVMQKRSKAIHSSGTDSFHDRLFRSETSAGALKTKQKTLFFPSTDEDDDDDEDEDFEDEDEWDD